MGYKEQKEAFVADGGGTSVAVINSVCLTALVCDATSLHFGLR